VPPIAPLAVGFPEIDQQDAPALHVPDDLHLARVFAAAVPAALVLLLSQPAHRLAVAGRECAVPCGRQALSSVRSLPVRCAPPSSILHGIFAVAALKHQRRLDVGVHALEFSTAQAPWPH
jgi:hypothetical protein